MYTFYFPRDDVKQALRNYEKFRDKFISATPNLSQSEKNFHGAYDGLIAVLNDERVKGPIEQNISLAFPHDFGQVVDERFVTFEAGVINSMTGGRLDLSRYIVLSGLSGASQGLAQISSVDALIALIAQSHQQIVKITNDARALERKEKKKRKKQIIASATYVGVGVTAIIANSFAAATAFTVPSIGAGAGAVVKGSADLYAVI